MIIKKMRFTIFIVFYRELLKIKSCTVKNYNNRERRGEIESRIFLFPGIQRCNITWDLQAPKDKDTRSKNRFSSHVMTLTLEISGCTILSLNFLSSLYKMERLNKNLNRWFSNKNECLDWRHNSIASHRLSLDLWLTKDNRFLNPKSSY